MCVTNSTYILSILFVLILLIVENWNKSIVHLNVFIVFKKQKNKLLLTNIASPSGI